MRVGRYEVRPGAGQREEDGKFLGHAMLTWHEEDATYEKPIYFDKSFDTEEDAKQHAVEQVLIRVRDGVL